MATSLMLAGTLSLPLAQTAQAQDDYVRDNRGRVVTDQYGNPLHEQSNGKSIAIIGGSTVGGAVLGGLIGGKKGAVLGGLAGAGAGVVIDKHRRDQRDEEVRQDAYNNGYYRNDGYYGNNGYYGDNRDGYYRQNSGYSGDGYYGNDATYYPNRTNDPNCNNGGSRWHHGNHDRGGYDRR